jgi:hypothetical protein
VPVARRRVLNPDSGPMRDRMEAAPWLTERGVGNAPQIVEHMGEAGEPVSVKVIWGAGD